MIKNKLYISNQSRSVFKYPIALQSAEQHCQDIYKKPQTFKMTSFCSSNNSKEVLQQLEKKILWK